MKTYSWQCFIFHDVDLIPEDDRNIYSCPPEPRHMSVAVNTMNYQFSFSLHQNFSTVCFLFLLSLDFRIERFSGEFQR